MNHATKFLVTMTQLEPLLRTHPRLARLTFYELCDYVAWFWNRGTISFVQDDHWEPHAICLVKLFSSLRQFLDPFVHEPCGKFCMIELMVADEPLAMGQIFEDLRARWGPQEIMLWDRGERTEDGAPRMYRWDQFEKLARRLTYGSVTTTTENV